MFKYLLSLLAVFALLASQVFGAVSNENNPFITVVPLGSASADALLPAAYTHKAVRLVSAVVINGASIAASDTDYVVLELKSGSTVIAEIDTRAAHENGLTADVAKSLNIVSAQALIAAGSSLGANYNETDSGTAVALTDAVLVLTWHTK